ncbi:uncharacterized protein LOC126561196 [Anopheles maculipalpis]|uniref:uncharacterized protein LOC126561196 n=1 Tax=Anopheles maculipalpis TaxID=1496333 RepID=UPI0021590FDE|nr:uncharacterized protein LOC126561196 [Anopheles maculipalpis]
MVHYHEILKTFASLGCKDEALCYAAARVYIHLKEEKRMTDVQYQYEKELQLLYFTARNDPEASINLFIPSATTRALNLVQLKRCREAIALPGGEKPTSIVLAICDPSSTVLLYRMTSGLKEIDQKLPSKGKMLRQRAETSCAKGKTTEETLFVARKK